MVLTKTGAGFFCLPQCSSWFRIYAGNYWIIPWLYEFIINKNLYTGSCSRIVTDGIPNKIWNKMRPPITFKWLAAPQSSAENCEIDLVLVLVKEH